MGFQVVADYDAINDIVNKINKTNESYKEAIKELKEKYEAAMNSGNWTGSDADHFRRNYEAFLSQLEQASNVYDELSMVLDVSKRYQEVDEEFGNIVLNPTNPIDRSQLFDEADDEYSLFSDDKLYTDASEYDRYIMTKEKLKATSKLKETELYTDYKDSLSAAVNNKKKKDTKESAGGSTKSEKVRQLSARWREKNKEALKKTNTIKRFGGGGN